MTAGSRRGGGGSPAPALGQHPGTACKPPLLKKQSLLWIQEPDIPGPSHPVTSDLGFPTVNTMATSVPVNLDDTGCSLLHKRGFI